MTFLPFPIKANKIGQHCMVIQNKTSQKFKLQGYSVGVCGCDGHVLIFRPSAQAVIGLELNEYILNMFIPQCCSILTCQKVLINVLSTYHTAALTVVPTVIHITGLF